MEEYKSNSYRSRENAKNEEMPRKVVQKAISGTARTRTNKTRKLSDIFLAEDIDNVATYVFGDVLVPAIKKAVLDIVTDGLHMIFYGDRGYSTSKRSTVDRVSYDRQYRKAETSRNEPRTSSRNRFSYEDVIVDTRGEAERVIDLMGEIIESYGMVRVTDLYDLVDLSCDYTCHNYGWVDISRAEAVRLRDGSYMIKMPKALHLTD